MNIKPLMRLTIDLISQPAAETGRLANESKKASYLIKKIGLPYIIAIIIADFVGHVIFGKYMFREFVDFALNVLVPDIFLFFMSGILFTILLNEILHYFSLKSCILRSLYIITYSFIPFFVTSIFSGLLPKLTPLFTLCGLYSYYILFCFLKSEYKDLSNNKYRNIAITTILSMMLMHWAIIGCYKLIF